MFRFVSYLIVGAILVIMPFLLSPYFHSMMTQILIFSIFAMSLNFVFGYTGLFSLGHAAYLGVAGYGSAILVLRYGVKSFWLAAPAGILMAVVLAAIFGILGWRSFRLRSTSTTSRLEIHSVPMLFCSMGRC